MVSHYYFDKHVKQDELLSIMIEVQTFKQILALKQEMDIKILGFSKRSRTAKMLLDLLYQKPIISIADIIKPIGVSKQTANTLVKEFISKNILIEETGFQRNQIFTFKRYLEIYSQS